MSISKKKTQYLPILLGALGLLGACAKPESAEASIWFLKHPCLEVVAIQANVNFQTGMMSAGGVKAQSMGECAKIIGASYRVYQDKNKNGKEDQGEGLADSSYTANEGSQGESSIIVAGFNCSFNISDGPMMFDSVVKTTSGTHTAHGTFH